MPGVGHGGPRKGLMDPSRRANAEAAKHALVLEARIDPPTQTEADAVRVMVVRNASTAEEAEMFLSMLLGDDA